MKVTVDKRQWDRLKKSILANANLHLKVGWFEEHKYGDDNDNLQVAAVAWWNEFGEAGKGLNGGIFAGTSTPPRPFTRVGFSDEVRQQESVATLSTLAAAVMSSKSAANTFNNSGGVFKDAMQQAIIKLTYPPNSEATIAMKGKDDPLRDTDHMLESVAFKVGKQSEDG